LVSYWHCDVRDIDALRTSIAAARDAFGPIRILINNAARRSSQAGRRDARVLGRESRGQPAPSSFATQAVVPQMAEAGGGSIISLGSISWMRGRPAMVCYTTSKAAISGMTRVLARELGERNIRVNAIVPGAIHTPRQEALWDTPESVQAFIDEQCLKFRLSEDDVARTALFLASNEARGITGQNLIVDAGLAQTSAGM
jgi:NAD(P)-dependent dehydrogenase (short-subunit alcohol dehydrogenase family)